MKTNPVIIRGEEWDVEYVLCMLSGMWAGAFRRAEWTPGDALVMKDGSCGMVCDGQDFDPEVMAIEPAGWDHDHCQVCNWTLSDALGDDHAQGYFNGYNWLCEECYRLFVLENRVGWQGSGHDKEGRI